MADEVRTYAVTVPPGTLPGTPLVSPLTMPARFVREVRVRVPPGPAGSVGFALGLAGQPIVPYNGAAWIIAEGEAVAFPLAGLPESGAWQLFAYNTGRYPHTLYVSFLLDVPGMAGQTGALVPLTVTP